MIFKTELGDWTCLGESSLKYINEHFPELIGDDTAVLKMVYNKDTSVKVYPVYQETYDGYLIRLNPKKNGNPIGLLTADNTKDHNGLEWAHFAYVAKTRKAPKPFDVKTLYEVLDEN